jgi:hypothetical protein
VREAARYLAAVAVLLDGALHVEQYRDAYFSAVPTIGTLFLLNAAGSTAAGLVLLAPLARLGRRGRLALAAAALAALGIAAGSLASLLYAEHAPLFGFRETGYRTVVVLALALDAIVVLAAGVYLAINRPAAAARARTSCPPDRPPSRSARARTPRARRRPRRRPRGAGPASRPGRRRGSSP